MSVDRCAGGWTKRKHCKRRQITNSSPGNGRTSPSHSSVPTTSQMWSCDEVRGRTRRSWVCPRPAAARRSFSTTSIKLLYLVEDRKGKTVARNKKPADSSRRRSYERRETPELEMIQKGDDRQRGFTAPLRIPVCMLRLVTGGSEHEDWSCLERTKNGG